MSGDASGAQKRLGVWITVFSEEKVLHSKKNADKMISECKKLGIDHVYLQVYRANKAYYDSDIADRRPYENITKGSTGDTIKYLLSKAKAKGIKVYAWMNLTSIAQNKEAHIIRKFGREVLTKDQYGRTSMQKGKRDELDKYFIRENQLFLEPGDKRVRKYISGIAEEIISKYPGFDGLHLDYVRYPAVVPFSPGSRFTPPGIGYGYGRTNTRNFKKATGLDLKKMEGSRENFLRWDSWRRDQVTELVREISVKARSVSPSIKISCTIVPSIERTYSVNFQDWTKWLRENYIDWVVVMNYTDDTKLLELNTRSMLLPQYHDKIYMGVGAFLLKNKPGVFKEQVDLLRRSTSGGIVIFSYDELMQEKGLQLSLAGS